MCKYEIRINHFTATEIRLNIVEDRQGHRVGKGCLVSIYDLAYMVKAKLDYDTLRNKRVCIA